MILQISLYFRYQCSDSILTDNPKTVINLMVFIMLNNEIIK